MRCFYIFSLLNLSLSLFVMEGQYLTAQTLESKPSLSASFKLKHLLISDTEAKVASLKHPEGAADNAHIVEMDVPYLNTKAFSDLVDPFINQTITPELFKSLTVTIKQYLRTKGHKLVSVIIPEQSVTKGDLRLIVVVGRYTLSRLYLTTLENSLQPIKIPENAGQIVVNDLPGFLTQPNILKVFTPYFARPITPESVNQLVIDLSNYVKSNGEFLAAVQIPEQTTESGILEIGLKIGKYPIKRLFIAASADKAALAQAPLAAGPIVALNMPLYATEEFKKFISSYLGKPITVESMINLQKDLILYGKNHDRLIVDTVQPNLDLVNGEIRIAVIIGHYDRLHFKGNRWFSDKQLEKKLGINPGDEIKVSDLSNGINWANQNPFYNVQVLLDTMNKPNGIADLDITVNEQQPVRLAASYGNAFNSPLGNSAYTGSVQLGNLWGMSHELNYQYSTNNTPKYDQSHSFDYKAPLFHHDFIRVDVAYSLAYPQSLFGYVGLNEKAKNTVVDLRYIKPITRNIWTYEFSAGLDYKQVNTNLFFGEYTQPVTVYDVGELILGENITRKDKLGSWTLGVNLDYSPGGINTRDTYAVYAYNSATGASTGLSNQYEYGKIILERDTLLPYNFTWVARGQMQLSTTNLQGSEQFVIGGGSTVRGYTETLAGDQGIVMNQELRSAYYPIHIPFTKKNSLTNKLNIQMISFLDYGKVSYKHPRITDINLGPLMGAGFGVRANVARHLNFGFDYGWQLLKPTYYEPSSRHGSFYGSLAY